MSYFSGRNYDGRNVAVDGSVQDAHIANTSNPHSVTAGQVGNAVAQWNANKLQGVNISSTAPTNGQLLKYNSGTAEWESLSLSAATPLTYNAALGALGIAVGTTSGTVAAGDDPRFAIPQVVVVKNSNAGAGEFTSITAALASITDNTSTKPYLVQINPGVYVEPPLVGKPYVVVEGVATLDVLIVCNSTTGKVYTGCDASILRNVTLAGATGSGGIGLYYEGTGLNLPFAFLNCMFGNNETNVKIYGNGNRTVVSSSEVSMGGTFNCTNGVIVTNDGSTETQLSCANWFVNDTSSPYMATTVDVSGANVRFGMVGCTFQLNNAGLSGSTAVKIYNGAQCRLFSSVIKGYKNGVWNPNTGAAADIHMDSIMFDSSLMFYLRVEHPASTGDLLGVVDISKMYVNHQCGFAIEGHDRFTIPVAKSGSVYHSVQGALDYINPTLTVGTVSGSPTITSAGLFHVQLNGAAITGTGIPGGTTVTFVDDQTMTMSNNATGTASVSAEFTVSSTNKKYIVDIGPGIYVEANPVFVDDYVSLVGRSNVYIVASNPFADCLQVGANVTIRSLTVAGAGAPGAAGVSVNSESGVYFAELTIAQCDIGIKCVAPTGLCQGVVNGLILQDISSYGVWIDGTAATSAAPLVWSIGTGLVNITAGSPDIFLLEGPYCRVVVGNINITGNGTTDGVVIRDGARVEMSTVGTTTCADGIRVENVGSGPHIHVSESILDDSVNLGLNIVHPGTTGVFHGIVPRSDVFVDPACVMSIQYLDPIENGLTNVGSLFLGANNADAADCRESIDNVAMTAGVYSGGVITVNSGLTIDIAAGSGYLMSSISPHVVKKYMWNATSLLLASSSTLYVYVNSSGTIVSNSAKPSTTQAILLGRVRTTSTGVEFIDAQAMRTNHISNRYDAFHRNAIGAVVASGIVPSGNTSRQLAVSSGKYYYSGDEFNPTGGIAPVTFSTYYHVAGVFARTTGVTVVDNAQYDNGTALAPLTAGYYVKHALYMVGDGLNEQYMLVYSQAQYATQGDARAADYPVPPNYFSEGVILLAGAITQQGNATYIEIIDRRPVITTNLTSLATTLDHGALLGLGDDDHTQYLLTNGSRAMGGDLDMGGNDIINVATVDGVDVSAHATRHLPNGSDPLTTAAPLANLTAATTNATGTANSFARSDHSHAITTGTAVSVGSTNSAGVSASLVRADHVHQGIHQLKANSGGTARFGDLVLAGGSNITITDSGTGTFTWAVNNSALIDNATFIVDVVDATKRIGFDAGGTTGTTSTLTFAQTANRTITFFDASDTVVGRSTTDVLLNKTFRDNSFTITDEGDTTKTLVTSLGGGSTGAGTTLTFAPTSNRVITFFDATDTVVGRQTTDVLLNKTFRDNSFTVTDEGDTTKTFVLSLGGSTTGTATTLASSSTASRVLTLPDATDTIVARTTTDTLTNKTMTSNTNNVTARGLWAGSGATTVSTYAATAPTSGQVLTATSSTTATWQTPTAEANTASNVGVAGVGVFKQKTGVDLEFKKINAGSNKVTITDDTTNSEVDIDVAEANLNINNMGGGPLSVSQGGTGVTSITSGNVLVGAGTSPITFTKVAPTGAFVGTTDTQILSNKSLIDNSTFILDVSDNTKRLNFDVVGSTGTTQVLRTNQSANRTIDIPDADDTFAVLALAQTFTNKTMTSNTNNVIARALWVGSGTGSVSTYASTAPTAGQILIATSATTATWQNNLAVGGNLIDNQTFIVDVSDQTKRLGFDVQGTTGRTTTFVIPQTINRNITFPDTVGNDSVVYVTEPQTIYNKTLIADGGLDELTIAPNADTTKHIHFSFNSAGTGSALYLNSNLGVGVTAVSTFPTTSTTLVGRDTTDTLTNKTMTSNTNNVTARGLWAGSGATTVSTYAATAPTTGQVLTATSSTTATWQSPSGYNSTATETNDYIPRLPADSSSNNKDAATTYQGGVYYIHQPVQCGDILFRIENNSGSGTFVVAIYQATGGTTGTMARVASGSTTINSTGNKTIAFTQGTVTLVPGIIAIIWGVTTLFTARPSTYYASSWPLLNTNTQSGTYPVTFTTAISVTTTPPATFNPSTQTTADSDGRNAMICRLIA